MFGLRLPAGLVLAAATLAACTGDVGTPTAPIAPAVTDAKVNALDDVDPGTLTPNPVAASDEGTDWSCRATGTGVKCVGHKTTIEEAVDIGTCADQTLYVNGVGTRDQVREYNTALFEISRDVHLGAEETLGLTPNGTGRTLSAQQNILQKITFGVPGDLATRARTESGLYLQVREPGGGVVFQDAGQQSYDENDELLSHRGRFDEDFLGSVCAALLAP